MREKTRETIYKNGHKWDIKQRIQQSGNTAPYVIYCDDEFWNTAEDYLEALEEVRYNDLDE